MNNFTIEIKDEENNLVKTSIVKRVKRAQLADLILLQQQLMDAMFQQIDTVVGSISIGNLLSQNQVWDTLQKTSALLNVVGEEKGFNLDAIEDDWVQITRIFFTQSCDDNGEARFSDENLGFAPSLIAELHQINYRKKLAEWILSLTNQTTVPAPEETVES
jgi:cyanate lyase